MRRRTPIAELLTCLAVVLGATTIAVAAQGGRSIADTGLSWPSGDLLMRVALLRDYNTRVVVLGVTFLGLAAGTIGTFLLLRKRSLTTDALSHAMLPGIALAFMVMVAFGGSGKNLAGLLTGAFLFGCVAMGCILLIRHTTRLKDDAALGIVLSVFFGLGLSLLSLIQEMPTGNAAGLNRFIFGKAASMLPGDAMAILVAALVISVACVLLFKELRLLCFDQEYARAQGWSVVGLDVILMGLVVAVTVVALQSVGLVLAVAMLIIPAAAARFWTDRLLPLTIGSAVIGMISGYLGAVISALLPRMPTGPVIVLVCSIIFMLSMVLGVRRGVLARSFVQIRLTRRVAMQHLLRALFEHAEADADGVEASVPVDFDTLLDERSWSPRGLRQIIGRGRRQGLVENRDDGMLTLTRAGWQDARRVVRNHRLWEVYLVNYADIAPSHVDRDADQIEHILDADLIDRLETLLAEEIRHVAVPPSPHVVGGKPSSSSSPGAG